MTHFIQFKAAGSSTDIILYNDFNVDFPIANCYSPKGTVPAEEYKQIYAFVAAVTGKLK